MKVKNLGFTLIENLIVMTLLVVVLGAGFVNFWKFNKERLLQAKSLEVEATLNEAYQRASRGEAFSEPQPYRFGVCFKDSEYTLFATFGDWATRDQKYDLKQTLPTTLHFAAPNLPLPCDSFTNGAVVFEPYSGYTARDSQITLYDDDTNEEFRFNISQAGLITRVQ